MSTAKPGKTDSSEALDALLDTESIEAVAIKKRFHRTMLWRFREGHRSPDLQTAIEIQKLSGMRVRADGWLIRKRGARGKAAA
jgi:hypothetical protein